MIDLLTWLPRVQGFRFEPLFDVDSDLVAATRLCGPEGRRVLRRHPKMEEAVVALVEQGLEREDWDGLLYIMGQGELAHFRVMYTGKAERRGVRHPISANIENIRSNKQKFARWGDGLDYHIGDLSHCLFAFSAYRKPTRKYSRWAEAIFSSFDPPRLREPVYVYLAPWFTSSTGPSGLVCSLPAAEKEVIALASVQHKDSLLNIDGA